MMIAVLGDCHGWWTDMQILIANLKADIVLQVGDFGYFPRHPGYDPRERIESPVPIHFCDGNHEDHERLVALRKDGERTAHEVAQNVFWQDRGSTLTLPDGRVVLFLGGADSIDKRLRTEGDSWFPGEQITDADMQALPDVKVDIVVSHTCPNEILMSEVVCPEALVRDTARERLDEVLVRYQPAQWFFGHWHRPMRGVTHGCAWEGLNDLSGYGCFYVFEIE